MVIILKLFILLIIAAIIWHMYVEYQLQKRHEGTGKWAKKLMTGDEIIRLRKIMMLVPIGQILVACFITGPIGWVLIVLGFVSLVIDKIKLNEAKDLYER